MASDTVLAPTPVISLIDKARYTRTKDLASPAKLLATHAIVIGVGAIGRQVALQLAAMGIGRLSLIDHDTVEEVNLGPQAYHADHVGKAKVQATFDTCDSLNPDCQITTWEQRFGKSGWAEDYWDRDETETPVCVFCCVDSMEARQLIWETVSPDAAFFVDTRTNAEVVRVLAAAKPRLDAYYATTLFADSEAFRSSCTARSTIYSANIAAGMAVAQFVKWLRDQPCEKDVFWDMREMALIVQE